MGPDNFAFGGWWIFPMIMCMVMMIFCFFFLRRGGFKPPWMKGSDSNNKESTDSETPLELLKKRYAKGDITKEDFEQMKKDLEG